MALDQLFGRDDQVVLKNPFNTDFHFKWDGKRYAIRAGAEQPLAGWMAEHVINEVIDRLMQEDGKHAMLRNRVARSEYVEKLVVSHSKMTAIDAPQDDGEVTILGEENLAGAPVGKPKGGLKLADNDPAVDEELDIDDLPDDSKLFPEPKKDKNGNPIADDPTADEDEEAFPDV